MATIFRGYIATMGSLFLKKSIFLVHRDKIQEK